MKKKLVAIVIVIAIAGVCFIPVTLQQSLTIKAAFFNTYQQFAQANNWKKWRSDLRDTWLADSSKITTHTIGNTFSVATKDVSILVTNIDGFSFSVEEENSNGGLNYVYMVTPKKEQNQTQVVISEKKSALKYLAGLFGKDQLSETHVNDIKRFMEDPDLYYGFNIRKVHVTDTNIVVLTKTVPAKGQLVEAEKLLSALKQYALSKQLRQTQPFIAQILPGRNDSVRLKIGLPVDKKIQTQPPFLFMTMPPGGYFYTATYTGKFSDKIKGYRALYQYFRDRAMQTPILPFETYLDNKLPGADTSQIRIRLNFSTF
jgi:hypothetical protein